MRILNLLLAENRTSLRHLGLMATVSGGCNAGLLAIVNSAAGHIKEGKPQLASVVLFLLIIAAYIYSQRYVLVTTSTEVEHLIHRCRERLIGRLKKCQLREVEHIGRGPLFAAIGTDTRAISQTADALVMGAQAAILIVCSCIYLATISMTSLVVSAVFLSLTARIYLHRMRAVNVALHEADDEESKLHDIVSGVLDGFKEVKLSSRRASEILSDFVLVSQQTANYRTRAKIELSANFIFAQCAFIILLGTLVFVIPTLGANYSSTVSESMTTVIFLFGPISGLVAAVPQMAIANAAAENIQRLEQVLDTTIIESSTDSTPGPAITAALSSLELRRIFFSHRGEDSQFNVGPIDLRILAGETVFITGGNGSGKSTLIKLLTGLYTPLSGELLANDIPVNPGNAQAFRDRFCAVFSDFHLFRKLYGIPPPPRDQVKTLLEEMEIAEKSDIVNGCFTNVDLSTGQRKRLALIAAIVEDKPIVILDEWAADQDPHFRRKFYDVLLPRLKAAGKTIIAVTHDDRYFHVADRRLHMEEGQLHDLTETLTHG